MLFRIGHGLPPTGWARPICSVHRSRPPDSASAHSARPATHDRFHRRAGDGGTASAPGCGSRSRRRARARTPILKPGFYALACGGRGPVALGYIDYGRRRSAWTPTWHDRRPDADMERIREFYRTSAAAVPERGELRPAQVRPWQHSSLEHCVSPTDRATQHRLLRASPSSPGALRQETRCRRRPPAALYDRLRESHAYLFAHAPIFRPRANVSTMAR